MAIKFSQPSKFFLPQHSNVLSADSYGNDETHSTCAICLTPLTSLTISLSSIQPTVAPSDPVEIQRAFDVTNNSGIDLTGITFETASPQFTLIGSTIAITADASGQITGTYTVNASDESAGQVTFIVVAVDGSGSHLSNELELTVDV